MKRYVIVNAQTGEFFRGGQKATIGYWTRDEEMAKLYNLAILKRTLKGEYRKQSPVTFQTTRKKHLWPTKFLGMNVHVYEVDVTIKPVRHFILTHTPDCMGQVDYPPAPTFWEELDTMKPQAPEILLQAD
jgi:hypothetical protein